VRVRVPAICFAVGVLPTMLSLAIVPAPVHAQAPARAEAEAADTETPIDYQAARIALDEVLARREFQRRDAARGGDELRRLILAWIESLLSPLFGRDRAGGLLPRVIAWTVSIGALIALGLWLFRLRLPSRVSRPVPVAVTPRLTSREWAARARAALQQGDAREAIRCAYHAALFHLEEQGVWRVDDSRTPREYLSLLRVQDARHAALADLAREFERVWYAAQPADDRGVLERLERVEATLR
jgi:hypothetical protein